MSTHYQLVMYRVDVTNGWQIPIGAIMHRSDCMAEFVSANKLPGAECIGTRKAMFVKTQVEHLSNMKEAHNLYDAHVYLVQTVGAEIYASEACKMPDVVSGMPSNEWVKTHLLPNPVEDENWDEFILSLRRKWVCMTTGCSGHRKSSLDSMCPVCHKSRKRARQADKDG